MLDGLVSCWNQTVRPEDRVYVLGDFALYLRRRDVELILQELNGEKYLIQGNHDHRDVYKAKGWSKVMLFQTFMLAGEISACMVHDPKSVDSFAPDYAGLVLHGHHHGNKEARGPVIRHKDRTYYDVGVDVDMHHYAPISETEIFNLVRGFE
jgi:calcineurin-like phosphoesterase family protein